MLNFNNLSLIRILNNVHLITSTFLSRAVHNDLDFSTLPKDTWSHTNHFSLTDKAVHVHRKSLYQTCNLASTLCRETNYIFSSWTSNPKMNSFATLKLLSGVRVNYVKYSVGFCIELCNWVTVRLDEIHDFQRNLRSCVVTSTI